MKKYLELGLFVRTAILLLTLILLSACDKDKPTCQGIDCLPPATQTGAGTFGCLVNGEPYVDNSGRFNCFYQLVNGKYYFGIQAEQSLSNIVLIGLGSNDKNIQENTLIQLNMDQPQNFYGGINIANLGGSIKTNNSADGIINFLKLDFQNKIVSATFEFTVTDPNTGTVYEITQGRFDTKFTQ